MTKKSSPATESLKIPKIIVVPTKLISLLSERLTVLLIAKIFTTPVKHKIPKREFQMLQKSSKKKLYIPALNQDIQLYENGTFNKKILIVHGWSGRGTQLFKISDTLLAEGYSTVSFDAPAHGASAGNSSLMGDFIESILEIDKTMGPFYAIIGHSLGGMAVLNAMKQGLKVTSAVAIGSGDIIEDVIENFVKKLGLNSKYVPLLIRHFEKKLGTKMSDHAAFRAASTITVPVLVLHDKHDPEVPVKTAHNIYKHLNKGKLELTENLGHRKILGNAAVISKIITFIKSQEHNKKDSYEISNNKI